MSPTHNGRNRSSLYSILNRDIVKKSLKTRIYAIFSLLIFLLAPATNSSAQTFNQNLFPQLISPFSFLIATEPSSAKNSLMTTLVVDDDSACAGASFTTIQAAVTAAAPGDTIQVCSGTYPISSPVPLNKAGITLIGTGATRPVIQFPGSTSHMFSITAANVTLDNLEIVKTDDTAGVHNLILVNANNFTAQNNLIYGPSYLTLNAISRAFEVAGSLSGLLFQNNTIHSLRQPAYINAGSPRTTGSILNNNVSGTRGWVIDGAKITFTGNTFGPPANNGADIALLASCDPADYPNLAALSASNDNAYISAQFSGGVSGRFTTYVDDNAPAGGLGTIDAPYQNIQQGINGVYSGGKVNVASGTYVEDVNINKADVILSGAGAASTTISGAAGGNGATVLISANNAEVRGFTITREGNNTTDWNNSNLNMTGIAVQGTSLTGLLAHDNVITGNRTGIDINNSNGHTIRNNVIDNNRTGLIFRNQTDNMTVTENFITNNWTVGVLFIDASGGINMPVQRAANSGFGNNNISGNWYGQIVDRQTGGSLPAPGTTNLKNFRGNWLGTTSPVVTTADSGEPGYAAQIPVIYGGTATAPGGKPDIAGPASANIKYTPFLMSGTDTNTETTPGRGTFGFQGTPLVITPAAGQGWMFLDESPAGGVGTGKYVAGPAAPPLGIGSAQLNVNDTGRSIFFNNGPMFLGTELAQITRLSYSSYQHTNAANPAVSISLQFPVDYDLTDTNNTFQGRIVYEPYQEAPAGTVQQNVWQNWNVLNGTFWATRTSSTGSNGACPQSNPCTRAELLAAFPHIGIHTDPNHGGLIFKLGGPISGGFTGNVDNFIIGINNSETTFDFEPVTPTVTINQATGQADPTSTSPINFTVTFSEPVTGFDSSDVTLSGTAGATTAVVTGSGATYNVAVSGMTGSGTVTATVPSGAAAGSESGAQNTASTSSDNTVTYFTCNNVSIPAGATVATNSQFLVPVNVDSTTGRNILAFDFTLNYNPAVITPVAIESAGTLSNGWTITTNNSSGTLVVSGFNTSPLSGAGILLNIRFVSSGGIGTTSNLNFAGFRFNEGIPCVNTTNGNVSIISGTISGRVTYANAPVTTPVPNTVLNASGSIPVSGSTDANGDYLLTGFGAGPYTVTPSKTGQVNGISNSDATAVAQHVVGFITLNSTQQMAADVTGNGTITSLDASYIAQYVAYIPNPGLSGTWKFIPASRSYANLQMTSSNQDYSAILMGEVTGNWNPNALRPEEKQSDKQQSDSARPEQAVVVTAPNPQLTSSGSNFTVDLTASDTTGENIFGYEFNLIYDSNVLMPHSTPCASAGTISDGRSVVCNPNTPGLLRVVVFSTTGVPISGGGTLLKLNFKAVGSNGNTSSLTFQNFMFNEGAPEDVTTNGKVLLIGPTAAGASLTGQVMSASNKPVSNARISITDTAGNVKTATSNPFGKYRFKDLRVGETYFITVTSKRLKFTPQTIGIAGDINELLLVADQ
jgi:hypothetical protein